MKHQNVDSRNKLSSLSWASPALALYSLYIYIYIYSSEFMHMGHLFTGQNFQSIGQQEPDPDRQELWTTKVSRNVHHFHICNILLKSMLQR